MSLWSRIKARLCRRQTVVIALELDTREMQRLVDEVVADLERIIAERDVVLAPKGQQPYRANTPPGVSPSDPEYRQPQTQPLSADQTPAGRTEIGSVHFMGEGR